MRILSLVLILMSVVVISAQIKPCTSKLEDITAIKGIRLGMTQAEVESVTGITMKLETVLQKPFGFSNYSDEIKNIEVDGGIRKFKYSAPKDNTNNNLKEISFMELTFYKDYLYNFHINYQPAIQPWNNIEEYTNKLSQTLNLPPDVWQHRLKSGSYQVATLRCDGFGAGATLQFPPINVVVSFDITDLKKDTEISEQAKKAAEEIRREIETRKP